MRFAITRLAVVMCGCLLLASCGGSSSTSTTTTTATTFTITTGYPYYLMPSGIVNTPYGFGFQTNIADTTVGGKGPVTFQLGSGASMPPGLTLDPSGFVRGTPSLAGSYLFAITAVDSSATPLTATATFSLSVRVPGAQLKQVGHLSLGAQSADVTVNGHYAFVGTRGTAGSCPASGVRVVDLSQVTNPKLVTSFALVAGASEREARLATGISSPSFHSGSQGDMAAVPLEACDSAHPTAGEQGVAFYDVTDPTNPVALGTWQSPAPGVRDVAIVPVAGAASDGSQNKIYALVSVPNVETDASATGDLQVLDITDPANPTVVGSWNILKALGIDPAQVQVGQDQRIFLDSIRLSQDGKMAYLAYWDEGVVTMDVSDPAAISSTNPAVVLGHLIYPTLNVATTTSPSSPEGNTHEALPVMNDTALLITDQICASAKQTNSSGQAVSTNPAVAVVCGAQDDVDLSANQGWGFLRTYSLVTPATTEIGGFVSTAQNQSFPAPDNGIYTAHDLAWNGDMQHPHGYVAWYSNGIVDVDLTSLSAPAVLGTFVPPATPDPAGTNPAVNNPSQPLVYGVAAYQAGGNQYILGSDMNSGLWVVQESPSPTFAILTTSLPNATLSLPYSVQLSATNGALGASNVRWTLLSSGLPPGLALSPQGLISGTPTASGSATFTVQASDGAGNIATETFSMLVDTAFHIVPVTLPEATTNEAYSVALVTVNGTTPVTWALSSGTLPAGITLDSSTGALSGTPTQAGTASFTAKATDSTATTPNSDSIALTLQVAPLTISTTTLPDGGVGAAYSQSITMANGTSTFTPTVSSGSLPPGVTLSAGAGSSGGTLTGIPTTAGTYPFTIQVTDADSQTATQAYTVVIAPFALGTTTLPNGTVNAGYSQTLAVTNGTSPYTFSVSSGTLPDGLSLTDTVNGIISGVPTTAGTYTFTIQVKDTNGLTTTQAYTLVIGS